MPNQTFVNLPKERQEVIIETSLREFIVHDYESASLNQVINELGIAKGSFYRYFDSKKDLYLYLIDYCIDKKFRYLSLYIDESCTDFFDMFKNLMCYFVKFNVEHPTNGKFMMKAHLNNDISIDEFLFLKNGKEALTNIILKFQKNGLLNNEYSVEFIFYCISQILLDLGNYFKMTFGISEDELITKEKVDDRQMNLVFDQVISFLKNGLNSKVIIN